MEPYRSNSSAGLLPETDKVAMRVLCLPTGTAVSQDNIKQVCNILRLAVENADAVCGLTFNSNATHVA